MISRRTPAHDIKLECVDRAPGALTEPQLLLEGEDELGMHHIRRGTKGALLCGNKRLQAAQKEMATDPRLEIPGAGATSFAISDYTDTLAVHGVTA